MKVVVNEQLGIQEIEIIINCSSKDETVQKIVSSLSVIDMKLTCRKDDEIFQLDPANILYIESVDRKTFLYTEQQIFETERRLYELEAYLENCSFFRASKAIIINLQRVQSLRPELGARLLLTMDNKEKIQLFERTPVPNAVAKLAVPTVLSSLVMVLYNLADVN